MTAILGTTGVVTASAVTGARLFGLHMGQSSATHAVAADPTSTSSAAGSADPTSSLDPVYVKVTQYYDQVVQVTSGATTSADPASSADQTTSGQASTTRAAASTSRATGAATTGTQGATAAPTQASTQAPTTVKATSTTVRNTSTTVRNTSTSVRGSTTTRASTTTVAPYNFAAWRTAHPGANLGNWPSMHPTQAPPTYVCGSRGGTLEDNGVWNCN